jgi:glycosyltransferase involved in cell wall biosynthesis
MYVADLSKAAASPTKIAEYLACGLPVLATREAGDVEALLSSSRTGVIASSLTTGELASAFERLLLLLTDPDLPARCRRAAVDWFDLDRVGGPRYRALYASMMSEPA